MRSFAYGSWLNCVALGSGVCTDTYLAGTLSILDISAPTFSPGGAGGTGGASRRGGVPGRNGVSLGGGAAVPLRIQHVCGSCTVPSWQERQPSVRFSGAGCPSILTFIILYPWTRTPHSYSSRTSTWGFLIRCSVFSIAVQENPALPIVAIFKARHMLDYSSCTWPPCFGTVADMLKTYKESVPVSKYEIGYFLNHIRFHSLL